MDIDKIALIPAYEPDEKLVSLSKNLVLNGYKVVIVNDGSSFKYDEYFDECEGYVISYSKNRGKGYALKKGLEYIKDNFDKYVVVTMDCDGQHTIDDANKLVLEVSNNLDYLVLGSRRRGNYTPLRSYLGNFITMCIYRLVTGSYIYDTQTGLRAFSYKLMDYMLSVQGDRYEYEMNVLLFLDNKVKEVPIETIYIDNNSGSHFDTVKDSFKIYKEIIKFSFSSIICFLIDYLFFVIFNVLNFGILFSNVLSRCISSIVNYNINKRMVFKSAQKSIIKYFSLVILVLILNSFVLFILTKYMNSYLAKIITEVLLFFFSYFVQHKFVFKGDGSV